MKLGLLHTVVIRALLNLNGGIYVIYAFKVIFNLKAND